MHVYSCQQGMYQTGIKRLRTSFLEALERILKMEIPEGFFIDVTNIPLEDRLKLLPQFENNYCRIYLECNKYCFAVNEDGALCTYSSRDKERGKFHRQNLLAKGLKECFIESLGGL